MKRLLTIVLALLCAASLFSAKELTDHFVTAGVSVGAAVQRQTLAGPEAGLSAGYALKYKHLLFQTQLAVSYRNLFGNEPDYADTIPSIDSQNDPFLLLRTHTHIHTSTRALKLALPLMIGGQWHNFYFTAGPAFSLSLAAASKQSEDLASIADYEQFFDPFTDMPNHGLSSEHINGQWTEQPNIFALDAALEIGYIFRSVQPAHKATQVIPRQWRLALYADFELWRNTPFQFFDSYSLGVRLSVWIQKPHHFPCHCIH